MGKNLLTKYFSEANFASTTYMASPEAGIEKKDLLNPEYWAQVAAKLRPDDIIRVIPQDKSFYLELLVTDQTKLWARVVELNYVPLNAKSIVSTDSVFDRIEAKHFGVAGQWKAVRKEGGALVNESSFNSREACEEWIEKHGFKALSELDVREKAPKKKAVGGKK